MILPGQGETGAGVNNLTLSRGDVLTPGLPTHHLDRWPACVGNPRLARAVVGFPLSQLFLQGMENSLLSSELRAFGGAPVAPACVICFLVSVLFVFLTRLLAAKRLQPPKQ